MVTDRDEGYVTDMYVPKWCHLEGQVNTTYKVPKLCDQQSPILDHVGTTINNSLCPMVAVGKRQINSLSLCSYNSTCTCTNSILINFNNLIVNPIFACAC